MELSYKLEDVNDVAKKLIAAFTSNIILFKGDLGSGKTTLIKSLAKNLGCTDTVSSPTFSIINEYQLNSKKIYHLDLYRIKNTDELIELGIEDYIYSNDWLFIEWPELIMDHFSLKTNCISLKNTQISTRKLQFLN